MSRKHIASVLAAFLILVPGSLFAQSAIAGVVRDPSGAVLPGVTVEAASPALIEKVRTAVTGSEGQYQLIDLRPGAYIVTFSLPGFSSVRRDGIQLQAGFTSTVNAELSVGAVEETITVTGAAPLVDVSNVASQRQLSTEILESIPVSRSPQGYVALTPGTSNQGLGSAPGAVQELEVTVHGSTVSESQWLVDGMNTTGMNGNGGGSNVFRISQSYVQEITVTTGGGTAEQQFGGMVTNVIPKEGGNVFSGSVYGEFVTPGMTMGNLTDGLRAQGFTDSSLTTLNRLWDIQPALGGRIIQDKLWFFGSYRNFGVLQQRAGIWNNLTPKGPRYTPDISQPSEAKTTQLSRNLRLTWQATPRNKIAIFADAAPQTVFHRPQHVFNGFVSPEATQYSPYKPNALLMASWKSPVTNRVLLDATITHMSVDLDTRRHSAETCNCGITEGPGFDTISFNEASTNTLWGASSTLGSSNYGHYASQAWQSASNMSYVTGTHAVKFGFMMRHGRQWFSQSANGERAYQLRNGIPISVTQYALPIWYQNNTNRDLGIYAQDQWRLNRLTITGGLRWDYYNASHAEADLGAGLWVPARLFPETENQPLWKDWSPRIAGSLDVFGDGKTAIKASLGRFVGVWMNGGNRGLSTSNPVLRSVTAVNRTWADADGDFHPDCDLRNPLLNGECGQINNLNFGQNNPNATVYDPELFKGMREFNWEANAVIQREIVTGFSMTAGYYHRWFGNFTALDNTLVTPSDFDQFCITTPTDSRLPGGGAQQQCGYYDVKPALFGRSQVVVRNADNWGNQEQVYDGVDLTANLRLPARVTVSGGVNWGRTRTNSCFVIDSPQALLFCDVKPPMLGNATFAGFVPLPWWELLLSATYRDFPGPEILATRTTPSSQIATSLGRNLSNGANGTVALPLISAGSLYAPRNRQLDFRVGKRFRFGSKRIMTNLDIFNIFNATGVDRLNPTYGPQWQRPYLLQMGRYVKVSGQFDF
jgi:hypothetical protein